MGDFGLGKFRHPQKFGALCTVAGTTVLGLHSGCATASNSETDTGRVEEFICGGLGVTQSPPPPKMGVCVCVCSPTTLRPSLRSWSDCPCTRPVSVLCQAHPTHYKSSSAGDVTKVVIGQHNVQRSPRGMPPSEGREARPPRHVGLANSLRVQMPIIGEMSALWLLND